MIININKTSQIEINVVEIEDHLPSFKVVLKICSNHLKGHIIFDTSVWFRYETWDDFENRLILFKDHKVEETVLTDLSNDVEIKIYRDSSSMFFRVVIKSFLGEGIAYFDMTTTINDDTFGHLFERVMGFEKWW